MKRSFWARLIDKERALRARCSTHTDQVSQMRRTAYPITSFNHRSVIKPARSEIALHLGCSPANTLCSNAPSGPCVDRLRRFSSAHVIPGKGPPCEVSSIPASPAPCRAELGAQWIALSYSSASGRCPTPAAHTTNARAHAAGLRAILSRDRALALRAVFADARSRARADLFSAR